MRKKKKKTDEASIKYGEILKIKIIIIEQKRKKELTLGPAAVAVRRRRRIAVGVVRPSRCPGLRARVSCQCVFLFGGGKGVHELRETTQLREREKLAEKKDVVDGSCTRKKNSGVISLSTYPEGLEPSFL